MDSVEELLTSVQRCGVRLWLEEGELRFQAPSGVLTADALGTLKTRKADVIAFLQDITPSQDAVPIQTGPRPARVPLSYAQERLWFLEQLGLVGGAYNVPTALHLSGELSVPALEGSVADLVRRHEILRTRFAMEEGEGIQIIDPPGGFQLPMIDLSNRPAEERAAEERRLAQQCATEPFNLLTGPLFRMLLLKMGPDEHVLLTTLHHIVSDGWSLVSVLPREIGQLYEARVQGRADPLQPLALQYADYALWQRKWLQGERLQRQLEYWKTQLADAPDLELPSDRPRPAVASYKGGSVPFSLSTHSTQRLLDLARSDGATLFMVVLAAFQVLLSRLSGQKDVVVGTAIAGRRRRELESLLGFFVNSLALRTDLSDDPSFRDVLSQVKRVTLQAYAHQDVPFEKLVSELQPERDLSRQPVFQAMLTFEGLEPAQLHLPGLRLRAVAPQWMTSKVDLSLFVSQTASGLIGRMEYASDLFNRETVERMTGQLQVLLEAIPADPQQRLSKLPLSSTSELEQLVVGWNQTTTPYPRERCIHHLIAEQARQTPDAVAVVDPENTYSYAELDRRANQLARYLIELGSGPECVVGVCMERAAETLVVLLGILKSGAAYLPLDVSYPQERLRYLLEDSGATIVLTQSQYLSRVSQWPVRYVVFDEVTDLLQMQSPEAPPVLADPDNLAYLIYTSGSTGKPKGVMVPHRAVVNYLSYARNAYAVKGGTGAPIITSLSFDATVTSLFTPLLQGLAVTFTSEEDDVSSLQSLSARAVEFSFLKLTPSHLELLKQMFPAESLAHQARLLVIGGEALTTATLKPWLDYAPATRLINEYGPTETAVGCSVYEVDPQRPPCGAVPIGRPIANTQLFVLEHFNVTPLGVVGELFIGGDGLARGYWNRPALTAERFLPNPFGLPGSRLYATDDRVRHRSDGSLLFLGRCDQQVKIRGYRIELPEIEAALLQHGGIRQAVVVAKRNAGGELTSSAYVIPIEGNSLDIEGVRLFLRERLPSHMLPDVIHVVSKLPLNSNGKVDREHLRRLEPPPLQAGQDRPRSVLEEKLAAILKEVLKADHVGLYDNFFDLGGHSLLAVRAIAQIQEVFSVDMSLRSLFECPTLAQLAERVQLEQARNAAERSQHLTEIATTLHERVDGLSNEEVSTLLKQMKRRSS